MSAPIQDPELGDADGALAAEHALGLLDRAERDAAERRTASDSVFARAVDAWAACLAPLADEIPPQTPPTGAWAGIERRLGGDGKLVEFRLRRSVGIWRAATAAATAIAASLALALVLPRSPPASPVAPPAPFLSARLTAPGGSTLFVAVLDPRSRQIILTPAAVAVSSGRSPELWLIPTGGRPVALGVAAFGRAVRLNPNVGLGSGALTLAVSIEPTGGSPTGQPTGPVVATGHTERL